MSASLSAHKAPVRRRCRAWCGKAAPREQYTGYWSQRCRGSIQIHSVTFSPAILLLWSATILNPRAATDRSICLRTMGVPISAQQADGEKLWLQVLSPRAEERDSGGRTMGVASSISTSVEKNMAVGPLPPTPARIVPSARGRWGWSQASRHQQGEALAPDRLPPAGEERDSDQKT